MKLNVSWLLTLLVLCAAFSPLGVNKAGASTLSASDIVSEINKERSARGLSALRLDSTLSASADRRSQVLVNLGSLIHVSSAPGTSWPELVEAGYINTYAGENLALGLETADALVREWMNSPSHRANILSPDYHDVGIGITRGAYKGASQPVSYVVAFFSSERSGASLSVQMAPQPVVTRTVSKPKVVEKVTDTKTTEATRVASVVPHVVMAAVSEPTPTLDPVSVDQNVETEISILKRLIALLESYLAIFVASQRA
jgi:hypothetical protein